MENQESKTPNFDRALMWFLLSLFVTFVGIAPGVLLIPDEPWWKQSLITMPMSLAAASAGFWLARMHATIEHEK